MSKLTGKIYKRSKKLPSKFRGKEIWQFINSGRTWNQLS